MRTIWARCIPLRLVATRSLVLLTLAGLIAGCAPAAPPSPTPAAPTAAPKPAEAKPTAAPAKPAEAKPTAAPKAAAATTPPKPAARPSTFEELARYMGADRTQILEEGARKEGGVQLYTSGVLTSSVGEIVKKFEQKYPFLKVEVFRASNDEVATRVIQEYRANQFLVDTFETTSGGLLPLRERNILASYNSPELAAFTQDAKVAGPNGAYWVVVRESYHGIGWNTTKHRLEEVPKTYEDLLDPRWKGLFVVPDAADDTIGAYIQARGKDFLDKLAKQNVRLMKVSARQLADLVISGEVSISLDLASAHVDASKLKGAPIEWLRPPLQPVPTNDGAVALAAKPPHPHAALLLADFFLSREGAKSYDNFQYGVPRTDMQSRNSLPSNIQRFYPARVPNYEQNLQEWKDLLLKLTTQ